MNHRTVCIFCQYQALDFESSPLHCVLPINGMRFCTCVKDDICTCYLLICTIAAFPENAKRLDRDASLYCILSSGLLLAIVHLLIPSSGIGALFPLSLKICYLIEIRRNVRASLSDCWCILMCSGKLRTCTNPIFEIHEVSMHFTDWSPVMARRLGPSCPLTFMAWESHPCRIYLSMCYAQLCMNCISMCLDP